jgi:hypothetical protein
LAMASTSSHADCHDDAETRPLHAGTVLVLTRRRRAQTPSLWGCLLRTTVGRVIAGRVAYA